MKTKKYMAKIALYTLFLTAVLTVKADEINLDKSSKCADMVCYQSLDNPDNYFYLPDQPRIAVKDGKPQFSFIKYARNAEATKAGTNRADGGGIVHFLVTYGVTDGRQKAAEKDLKKLNPNAKIIGPVIYRSGSFALVTSFTKENKTTTKTVAVGKAPLMEGQKAAVSMGLTREGAELLWESFKADTPDISLVFDMEFAGVREPYKATLEADWKRVASHKRLKVGGQYKWFGADIDILFQELKQDGAIKITTKGEDAILDKILQSAHAKLLQVMFEPGANDELNKMAAEKDDYSNLDRAVKMLKDSSALKKAAQVYKRYLNRDGKKREKCLAEIVLDFFVASAYAGEKPQKTDEERLQEALPVFEKGLKSYNAGRYKEAIKLADKSNKVFESVKKRPSIGSLWLKANSYYQLGKYQKAIDFYQKSMDNVKYAEQASHKDKEAFGNLYIAMSLNNMKRDREAQLYIDISLTKNFVGSESSFYRDLGVLYSKMDKLDKSVEAYRKAMNYLSNATKAGNQVLRSLKELYVKLYNKARKLDDNARGLSYKQESTLLAYNAYKDYKDIVKPIDQKLREVNKRIEYLKGKLTESGYKFADEQVASAATTGSDSAASSATASSKSTAISTAKSVGSSSAAPTATTSSAALSGSSSKNAVADKPKPKSANSSASKKSGSQKTVSRKPGFPGFSLVASYKMKRIKRSGKMVYKMNHYRNETQAFAMAENIGSLFKKYGNDPAVFRAVNLDDPVFKQRDIMVTLDGQDAATFGKHVNYVTVQMKKIHQNGERSTEEVVITPELFNNKNNSFFITYSWKGDDNREQWHDYQVKTVWSFHGGVQVESKWQDYDQAVLSLLPPHRYRTVSIEADADRLKEKKVRHVVVSLKSYINGKPVLTQTTIRNKGISPSALVDVPESKSQMPTVVDMVWYLEGGKKLVGKPGTVEGEILYWDELPEEE